MKIVPAATRPQPELLPEIEKLPEETHRKTSRKRKTPKEKVSHPLRKDIGYAKIRDGRIAG